MSTYPLYTQDTNGTGWTVPMTGTTQFTWEYDEPRARLLALYQKGKDKQWDATKRIDWDLEVDPYDALGLPEQANVLYGTDIWNKMSDAEHRDLDRHSTAWQLSQFLHGEQGAMICSARIVEAVPDLDSKFYAATQTMDEARHVETYSTFLHEKMELAYPMNPSLQNLLDSTLSDSRWDMPYLGMQVLIEGVALAAFGLLRDMTTKPLPKQILAYVMQDEARHVAFGRIALKDYYANITQAERDEREEFVVEGCYLLRDRLKGREVWETFGLPADEMETLSDNSEYMKMYRSLLFSRIVPCVKDIGLWGEKVQKAYADMGVLDYAGFDLDALMKQDEETAEQIDADKADRARFAAEEANRHAEVADIVSLGAE
jgi:hypothetical protein